eukprot:5004469-Pleurochrysis_carterae.AAC.4
MQQAEPPIDFEAYDGGAEPESAGGSQQATDSTQAVNIAHTTSCSPLAHTAGTLTARPLPVL